MDYSRGKLLDRPNTHSIVEISIFRHRLAMDIWWVKTDEPLNADN